MAKEKRSFFERLTGSVRVDDTEEQEPHMPAGRGHAPAPHQEHALAAEHGDEWMAEEAEEGQLTVDMHQTPSEIVVKTMVAGVRPEDLDISITRDMITIKGKREGERNISDDSYFHRELYWGSFGRTIILPAEVEPEEAEAVEKHGLLIIRLPKINKDKQMKVRVKTL